MEWLIFVIDSDPESCELMRRCLESASFAVRSFPELEAAMVGNGSPSLIIFGLHPEGHPARESKALQGMFGGVPRLIVTDSGSQENRRRAFRLGADDWLCKPFSVGKLLLRVRHLLRRAGRSNDFSVSSPADLLIDNWGMKLCVRGNEIATTTLEFRLVEYLARHRGQVFTRDFLLDAVWGNMKYVTPRSVDACIARIREKIELDRTKPTMLKTVRGVGYRMDAITAWQSAPSESCGCPACTTRIETSRMDVSGVTRRRMSAETSST